MTRDYAPITDEPHKITDCQGRGFVVFDANDCRVTINGENAEELARTLIERFNGNARGRIMGLSKEVERLREQVVKASSIAKDIIERGAWRDHWESDHVGGENVRRKINEIASLESAVREVSKNEVTPTTEIRVTPELLVERLRAGEKWRPITWRDAALLKDGWCCIKSRHTFVQNTPKTVGCTVSPAIIGAEEAIEEFGDMWEQVQ